MKTLSKQLAENLKYYTDNPNKRCISEMGCKYSGKTLNLETDGCFVGRLFTEETRDKLDALDDEGMSVGELISVCNNRGIEVPNIISDNIVLMAALQQLHDGDWHWNKNGLSDYGVNNLKNIITDRGLDINDFKDCMPAK